MFDRQEMIYRPRLFQNHILVFSVLGTIFTAYLLWFMAGLKISVSLVLAAQIVLYILLFTRPVWAMAALIVGQLTLSNYMFPLGEQLISIRFLWAILTLFLLVPILNRRGGIKLGSGAKRIIIPAIILCCIATISNLINIDISSHIQYLRQEFILLIILCLLPATVENEKDLKGLALVALITCSVSAIFALIQYYTPALRDAYDGRIVGLSESPVQLAYNLPMVLLPAVAVYLLMGTNTRLKILIVILIIIMSLGLYFTFTRTGIYSLVLGLVLMILLMKGRPKKELFLVTLILGSAFFYFVSNEGNRYTQGFTGEESPDARLTLWQAGINIAMDYPLVGIGAYRFKAISQEYASTMSSGVDGDQGTGTVLGLDESHNDFLTVWTSFGIFALLVYLWLFVGIIRNFLEASRHSRTRFLKGLAIGCLCATVAYIMNAANHNVMSSSMIIWILGGLSIATNKIASSERLLRVKETP